MKEKEINLEKISHVKAREEGSKGLACRRAQLYPAENVKKQKAWDPREELSVLTCENFTDNIVSESDVCLLVSHVRNLFL